MAIVREQTYKWTAENMWWRKLFFAYMQRTRRTVLEMYYCQNVKRVTIRPSHL